MDDRLERLDLGALLITIEEEADTLDELTALLTEEAERLRSSRGAPLLENLSCQEKILRRIGKLEEQRLKLVESLSEAGLPPAAALTEMAASFDGERRARVLAVVKRIADRGAEIRRLARRNRRLIEAGLKGIDGFLRLILAPEAAAGGAYGPPGRGEAAPRLVERRA